MQRIPTRLGGLAVEVVGSGPPALLWHSFFVDARSWRRVVPALAEERTLVLVDGPGFGGSDPLTRRITLDDCAEAAASVLDQLGFTAVDWVGNAWGGHTGIAFGARYPDRLRTLVAIGAPVHALGAHGGSERRQVAALAPVARVVGLPAPLARVVAGALLNDRTRREDPKAVRIVVSCARRRSRRSFDLALRSVTLGRRDLTEAALALRAPVLFAAGDDRGEWTPAEAQAVTDRMADASTATLHGVRGIAPLEDPRAVIELVRSFWRTRSA